MATKLATRMYELSSTETLNLTVAATGLPFLLRAALDDTRLDLQDRVLFPIRPRDLNGSYSYHLIELRLFFPDPATKNAGYKITVADQTSTLEEVNISPQTATNPAQVSLEFWIV